MRSAQFLRAFLLKVLSGLSFQSNFSESAERLLLLARFYCLFLDDLLLSRLILPWLTCSASLSRFFLDKEDLPLFLSLFCCSSSESLLTLYLLRLSSSLLARVLALKVFFRSLDLCEPSSLRLLLFLSFLRGCAFETLSLNVESAEDFRLPFKGLD